MKSRIFTAFFIAILSLGYLSVGILVPAERRLASCVEPIAESNIFPLPGALFGEVKDEALRKSTMDYYLFLSQVEMQAIAGRQSIRAMYGITDAPSLSVFPAIAPFDPQGGAFATGFLWGELAGLQTKPASAGRSLPGLSIPPYTLGLSAQAGEGFLKGYAFPATNSAAHKVGAF